MILTKEDGTEEVSGDAVSSFLFDLIRDHVPLGVVEKLIVELEDLQKKNGAQLPRIVFQDPNLGKYVGSLSDRLYKLAMWDTSLEALK